MTDESRYWQHAGLSLVILISLIGVLYMGIIHPAIMARVDFNDRIEVLNAQYNRLTQLIERKDRLQEDAEVLSQYELDQTDFLGEKTVPLAAADLQQILNDLISNAGGSVTSTQVINNASDQLFQEVSINVSMHGDIETLQQLLFTIHQNKPALFINNLMITRQGGRRAPRQFDPRSRRRVVPTDVPDILEIRFDVSGYIYRSDPTI